MCKLIAKIISIGFLCGQLLVGGCASTPTISKPAYKPFLSAQPVSEETLLAIKKDSPKDAVFANLLQAFAFMRSGPIEKKQTQDQISNLLADSVGAFEDMSDPANFSKAFSADESKNFRGSRTHEGVFSALMAGVFMMAKNRCDMALPYLRNSEFLDARFQKMPFNDAALSYALRYRCLKETNADAASIKQAHDGVVRSVRFLSMQTPLIEALVEMSQADLRPFALPRRLAYMIFEIAIYNSLLSAPNNATVDQLIVKAVGEAEMFTSLFNQQFEEEYKARMENIISEQAEILGLSKKEGMKHLQELMLTRVSLDVKNLGENLKRVMTEHSEYRDHVQAAQIESEKLSEKILDSVQQDKLAINFTGVGPALVREGSYNEISVIKPGPDANMSPRIRIRAIPTNTACGFHRTDDGGFSVVLCKNPHDTQGSVQSLPSAELFSLSRKATTVAGRQFDKVLKGRAQFRAATESIATVSAWSALFLFYLGASVMEDCSRRGEGEACYTKGLVLWAVAGITVVFTGTVWLVGRISNPAADSRYIHLMYESTWVNI